MNISQILEHWAAVYRPLSHDPESPSLAKQSFFRIRDIEEENIFTRNANIIHSPCMLHRVITNGESVGPRAVRITNQVCFLIRLKDSPQSLGRYDGLKLQQASDELMTYCEDLISYLAVLKRTQECPVTGRSFKEDPRLMQELASIDFDSFAYGVNPFFHGPQWMLADCYWTSVRPLFNFACDASQKYIIPESPNP